MLFTSPVKDLMLWLISVYDNFRQQAGRIKIYRVGISSRSSWVKVSVINGSRQAREMRRILWYGSL